MSQRIRPSVILLGLVVAPFLVMGVLERLLAYSHTHDPIALRPGPVFPYLCDGTLDILQNIDTHTNWMALTCESPWAEVQGRLRTLGCASMDALPEAPAPKAGFFRLSVEAWWMSPEESGLWYEHPPGSPVFRCRLPEGETPIDVLLLDQPTRMFSYQNVGGA